MDKEESGIWNKGFDRGIAIFATNLKNDVQLIKLDVETNMVDLDNLNQLIDKLLKDLSEN